jgi:hypothetical protein
MRTILEVFAARWIRVGALGLFLAMLSAEAIDGSAPAAQVNSWLGEQIVFRNAKADRLVPGNSARLRQAQPRSFTLLNGCEAAVSPIADQELARLAARCLS